MSDNLHTVTWPAEGKPSFKCAGTAESSCHTFPDCDCEIWSPEHNEKHPAVPHEDDCWVLEWLEALGTDGYDESEPFWGASVPHIDGPIDWEWEYDSLIWRYPEGVVGAEEVAE